MDIASHPPTPAPFEAEFRASVCARIEFWHAGLKFLLAASFLALILTPVSGDAATIYVSNYGSNTIEKFDSETGIGSVFASTGLNAPYGLALDGAGNLYAANSGNDTIMRFTPDGIGSVFASSGLFAPVGLVFDSAGNLYAANYSNSTIKKFTPDGVGTFFASTGSSSPFGLAFDSAGNLYTADWPLNTITRFTLGGIGSVFANTGLSNLRGLAFDNAGNLYVANSGNNTIKVFTPDGVASVFANTGLSNPMAIAIRSTPEPATCGLLALAGALHLAVRRRRGGMLQ